MWIVVAAIVVLIGAFVWWQYGFYQSPPSPTAGTSEPLSGEDTTAAIEQDLGAVDLGNVGEELDQLDKDINQL